MKWLLLVLFTATASAQVINCGSGFASSGSCGVSLIGGGGQALAVVGSPNGSTPALSGSQVLLAPTGATHTALSLNYQTAVNIQAFTTTFKFIPNGSNVAFVWSNNTNANAGGTGPNFSFGAGCEGGFYQGFGTAPTAPNKTFAIELDSYSPLTNGGSFTYSSVQAYQITQSPCNPDDGASNFWLTTKLSTSPVPLNSPASLQGTTTGDTYSATITYDGTNLEFSLFDVTASGSCPGASCFSETWTAVDLPAQVDGNTAYVGITEGTGGASSYPLYVTSMVYTVNSPPTNPSLSTYTTQSNAGATPAANPTFSPVAGSYSGTQSVTITCPTTSSYACYSTGTAIPSIPPQTDNMGGCQSGTAYSAAVSVSSSTTLYAMCGTTYTGLPSALTTAAYTISTFNHGANSLVF